MSDDEKLTPRDYGPQSEAGDDSADRLDEAPLFEPDEELITYLERGQGPRRSKQG